MGAAGMNLANVEFTAHVLACEPSGEINFIILIDDRSHTFTADERDDESQEARGAGSSQIGRQRRLRPAGHKAHSRPSTRDVVRAGWRKLPLVTLRRAALSGASQHRPSFGSPS